VRHLGQEREVTTEQAVLDKRVLRLLFRHGQQVEGLLAGKCSLKINAPAWRDAMSRLEEWGFICADLTGHGNARLVELTDGGKLWGEELACTTNIETLREVSSK
jgi:hypothetical protein